MKEFIDKPLYTEFVNNMPIVCVDVCIKKDGKILIAKRKTEPMKDKWFLPGGRVLKYETLEHAAMRKTYEETHLDCKVIEMIHTSQTIFMNDGIDGVKDTHTVNICFELAIVNERQELILDESNSEYIWLDKKNMYDYDLHEWCLQCLSRSYHGITELGY